jgi:hypothetical protein
MAGKKSAATWFMAGLCLILVEPWIGALLSVWVSSWVAIFAAVIVGIVAPMLFDWSGRAASGVGLVIAAAAAGILGVVMCPYPPFGASAGPISVSQAVAHAEAVVFRFTDGHVEESLSGSKAIYGRSSVPLGTQRVAPLVPEGWTVAQPVTAWVATDATFHQPKEWSSAHRAGVRYAVSALRDEIGAAVEDATTRHHLIVVPNAPVLWWCKDPDAELSDMREALVMIGWIVGGLWGLVVVVEARKRKT